MNIIITGCAGFIGFHTCKQLLKRKNIKIFGLDSLNKYYNIDLKKIELKNLKRIIILLFINQILQMNYF